MAAAASNSIDIKGLDKRELLKALWCAQVEASFYQGSGIQAPAFKHDADLTKYIDYHCGRAIKIDLSGDTISPSLYDRDAGKGKCAEVVAAMRTGKPAPGPAPTKAVDKKDAQVHITHDVVVPPACVGCHMKFDAGAVVMTSKGGRSLCKSCHAMMGAFL